MKKNILKLTVALLVLSAIPVVASAQSSRSVDSRGTAQREAVLQIREQAAEKAAESQPDMQQQRQAIQQQVEQRTMVMNQTRCESQQRVLVNAVPRLSQNATAIKDSLDRAYARITTFYEEKALTVENYEFLVNTIEAAKVNSEVTVATIGEYKFEVNCADPNIGQQLHGYRLSVQTAQPALREYRQALLNLVEATKDSTIEEE